MRFRTSLLLSAMLGLCLFITACAATSGTTATPSSQPSVPVIAQFGNGLQTAAPVVAAVAPQPWGTIAGSVLAGVGLLLSFFGGHKFGTNSATQGAAVAATAFQAGVTGAINSINLTPNVTNPPTPATAAVAP